MSNIKQKYGVELVKRPHVKAQKNLDLTGLSGKQIVLSETKLVLLRHKKTFTKLAYM